MTLENKPCSLTTVDVAQKNFLIAAEIFTRIQAKDIKRCGHHQASILIMLSQLPTTVDLPFHGHLMLRAMKFRAVTTRMEGPLPLYWTTLTDSTQCKEEPSGSELTQNYTDIDVMSIRHDTSDGRQSAIPPLFLSSLLISSIDSDLHSSAVPTIQEICYIRRKHHESLCGDYIFCEHGRQKSLCVTEIPVCVTDAGLCD